MACANIATQMTFLGQGASNMAWNDVMMQAGAPTPLHIWDFTIARIPMLTIAILYMTFVGYADAGYSQRAVFRCSTYGF